MSKPGFAQLSKAHNMLIMTEKGPLFPFRKHAEGYIPSTKRSSHPQRRTAQTQVSRSQGLNSNGCVAIRPFFNPMVMTSSTTPSTSFFAVPAFLYSIRTLSPTRQHVGTRTPARKTRICAKLGEKSALQYKKLGDSDLSISEITFGTVRILPFFVLCYG
jgi:hypothetical protein